MLFLRSLSDFVERIEPQQARSDNAKHQANAEGESDPLSAGHRLPLLRGF